MNVAVLRAALRLAGAAGIPGLIAGSVAGNDGVAITFGALTAVAAFGLIVLTAATPSGSADAEALGAAVEDRIAHLVAMGADEAEVRALVGDAVRLGRNEMS